MKEIRRPFRARSARRFDRPRARVVDRGRGSDVRLRRPTAPNKLVIRRGRDRRKIKVRRERVRETRTHIYILMRLYNRFIRVSRTLPPGEPCSPAPTARRTRARATVTPRPSE